MYRVLATVQAKHRQRGSATADHFAWALRLPNLYVVRDAHPASAGNEASLASGPLSAVSQYTGQLSKTSAACESDTANTMLHIFKFRQTQRASRPRFEDLPSMTHAVQLHSCSLHLTA